MTNIQKPLSPQNVASYLSDLVEKIHSSYDESSVGSEIESAKATLKEHGYYTESLWRIEDVQSRFNATEEQAQEVLDRAHKSSTEDFFERIHIVSEEMGLSVVDDTEKFNDMDGNVLNVGDIVVLLEDSDFDDNIIAHRGDTLIVKSLDDIESNLVTFSSVDYSSDSQFFGHRVLKLKTC